MTTRQIASETGIPARTVTRYLHKAGVQLRCQGAEPISVLHDADWLRAEYVQKQKSTTVIGKEINCSNRTVVAWLKRHGIEARPTGLQMGHPYSSTDKARENMSRARRGKFIGAANNNWRGGIQVKHPDRNRYPYKKWVKLVKDRDGWKCTECGSPERLHAHHIKRWQDYPDLRYELSNGLTLCKDCHELAHGRGFKFPWNRHAKIPTSAPASLMEEA